MKKIVFFFALISTFYSTWTTKEPTQQKIPNKKSSGIAKIIKKEILFNKNNTPYHEGVLIWAIKNNHKKIWKAILENKENIDKVNENGHSPFSLALDYCNIEVIKYLAQKQNADSQQSKDDIFSIFPCSSFLKN